MNPPFAAFRRGWRLAAAALLIGGPVSAQVPTQLPTPAQLPPERARELLRQRPDLAAQLRERIGASGLTPEQVRARLRAAGYPDDLLDPYLEGADSLAVARRPTSGVVEAVRILGVVSAEEADSLRQLTDSAIAVSDSLERIERERGEVRIFGADVFRRGSTQFQPALGGPVDDNYILGPGDVLALILTGDVELAHTLEVNREGFIVIPQVGQVYVANQSLSQLRETLYTRLGRVYSGVRRGPGATTRFQVSLGRLRAVQVYVAGDARRPGAYQVSGAGTVLTALYAAGGPSDAGSFRAVDVRRGDSLLGTVDLYDYLLKGINRSDIKLGTGDVVFVPPHGARVTITGEVLRPAIYEVRPGETLRDLIRSAGGFTAEALRTRVQIHRVLPPAARGEGGRDRVVVDIQSDALKEGVGPAYPVEASDSVVVFSVADRKRAVVRVRGNVWVEGEVGFTPGMKLGDAIRLAGGPKPDVYLGSILVSRLRPDSTRAQLRSAFADSTGQPTDNLALEEDDEIRVFSRSSFRSDRYVTITGAVRKPGRQEWHEGMTVRDAVLQASGLREDAYLVEAEVARLPEDRAGGAVARTFRVPLDSTYVFDRSPDGKYLGPPGIPSSAKGADETVLRPYDNVLILTQPQWEQLRAVYVGGQVNFPGNYALRSRTERLADVLARAGGLTKEAYPEGIEFFRTSTRDGRIGVDLPRVLRDSEFRDNLILQGGDSIVIPEYNPVIRVAGAVNAPQSVAYVPGKNIDYYVRAAGGYNREGDKGRAYVTQPSGKAQSVSRRFWLLPDGVPQPRPGAQVFVPVKEKREGPGQTLAVLGTVATIIASLATVIVVARR